MLCLKTNIIKKNKKKDKNIKINNNKKKTNIIKAKRKQYITRKHNKHK